jgi:sporulation protein YlmC with PRC-barrel domain
MEDPADREPVQTVVGLFDDEIDAEHALVALRKASVPRTKVSVLALDRRVSGGSADTAIDVTRAVMDTAVSAVSAWLMGLAALMVPNHGNFLAAGPIGVELARIKSEANGFAGGEAHADRAPITHIGIIGLAFERFGFRPEEAHYMEHRLVAGSTMIAVTTDDSSQVELTLRTFADHNAVFLGQAETPREVVAEAEQWLVNPPTARSAEVIVSDIVVPFRHACGGSHFEGEVSQWCGQKVVDERGDHVGDIDDILVDPNDDSLVRYVIVGHGGVLGIARRRYAVPADAISLDNEPARLNVERWQFADAPAYDPGAPFSRKDEQAVHAYFDTRPYWAEI